MYWPSDGGKHPLLSFAHGWTEGGAAVGINYKDVIETVAAAGYIVIAEHSGATRLCYKQEENDQLHAIDYIKKTSEFSSKVDWTQKVGLYGRFSAALRPWELV